MNMTPDLNSVPMPSQPDACRNPSNTQPASNTASHQNSTPASRRTSQIFPMNPPPLLSASPGGTLPMATQFAKHQGHVAFPPLTPGTSGTMSSVDSSGVPMRHPRPMTAVEMHLELEKEQEAVVNRLTRELSALRAHSVSVASTTSNATDSSAAHADSLNGPTHPTSSRRHRSSSSVSRSFPHRHSVSSQSGVNEVANRDHGSSSVVSTLRYEEVAQQKAELEELKKENEALKQRIRELEKMIKDGGGGVDAVRGRTGTREGRRIGAAESVVQGHEGEK